MRLIRKLLFLILILLVGGFAVLTFTRPYWKSDLAFIPPLWVDYDCSEIQKEIGSYDWDTKVATAVMKAESGCNANAHGDEDLTFSENGREYGYSVGAFQVRVLPGREDCDSYDVKTNVKCAYDLYKRAGSFSDWTMYKNGAYKKYLWRTFDDFMAEIKT